MTQLKISGLLISFLIFTIGALLLIGLINEVSSESGDFIGDDKVFANLSSSFDQSDDILDEVETLKNAAIIEDDPGFLDFGVLGGLVKVTYTALKAIPTAMLDSAQFAGTIIDGFARFLGLPSWLLSLVLGILGVIVIFALISAVFQRDL